MKRKYPVAFWSLYVVLSLFVGPRTASASLPAAVQALAELPASELNRAFLEASVPQEIPSGYAVGTHVIPEDSRADVPFLLQTVTFCLWKGKEFDGAGGIMYDRVSGIDLHVRAALSIASIADVAAPRYGQDSDIARMSDGFKAVITDYGAIQYSILEQGLFGLSGDPRDWIDEFREVSPGVWLGRSYYHGRFWGYVILSFADAS